MRRFGIILTLLMLTGCQTATEALDENDIRKTNLVESECAIYFTVRAQMASRGQIAKGTMTDGCPPSSQEKRVSVEPVASPSESESRFESIIYQRMISRGMPKDIADRVRKSKVFYDLVAQSDALYG